jgi:glyoxylase-like metal-dependent hydrolase (beta-lactamase superfamily II)
MGAAADPHVATRTFGGVEVSVVRTAVLHWPPEFPPGQEWESPETRRDEQGRAVVDVLGMVVRTANEVVVVDPGAWEENEHYEVVDVIAGQPVDGALATLGLTPADVTHVVVTHPHLDHISGLVRRAGAGEEPRFAGAEHLFAAADWEASVVADPEGRAAQILGVVERAGLLTLTGEEHAIGAGVHVLAAPGETPGHQVLRAGSDAERAYLVGDLFHFPSEFEHLDWALTHAEPVSSERSRHRILADAAGADSTFVYAHGRFPGWGRVERLGDGWRWHYL